MDLLTTVNAEVRRLAVGVTVSVANIPRDTAGRQQLAMDIAGIDRPDSKNRAYNSAMRRLQRYTTQAGEKRGQRGLSERDARALRDRVARGRLARRGVRVEAYRGDIVVTSGDEEDARPRAVEARHDVRVGGAAMRDYFAALDRADALSAGTERDNARQEARDVFSAAFTASYGGFVGELRNVERLELDWGT